MKSLWNPNKYKRLSLLDQLVVRSRLIGQEPKLCVWGGGNTSSKITERDGQGVVRQILRIKGSGSDLKSCQAHHFTPLDLKAVLPLQNHKAMTDQEMVNYLASCQVNPKAPRSSIEALLHAFVPHPHIDHTHADVILSVTNQRDGQKLARKLYGRRLIWIPYVKPGFLLSKKVALAFKKNPDAEGVILEKHGLITWGQSSQESYKRTIHFVTLAEKYFAKKRERKSVLGGVSAQTLSPDSAKEWRLRFYPLIRSIAGKKRVILSCWRDKATMRFVNSRDALRVSQVGPATPDHMLRTKRSPLFVRCPHHDPRRLTEKSLALQIEAFAENHRKYYRRFKRKGMFMLDPYPKVILIPGIGMITTGKNKKEAEITAEVYWHSIQIQTDASLVSPYASLSMAQQFEMEYWDMELYKLSLAPPEKELARQVAVVTGACGAIGQAICEGMAKAGAQVVVTDLDKSKALFLAQELNKKHGDDSALGLGLDVTSQKSVKRAVDEAALHYGGIDILVSNAGIAKIASIGSLLLSDWEKSFAVNATGHFLIAKECLPFLRRQARGGSLIFITTKNVLAPGKDFGAYSASKAAEAQLARVLAIENGDAKIRVNMVNPDGVFEGSGLWNPKVRRDRAKSYGIAVNRLEDFYRKRNLLNEKVTAQDVAEAVLFFAGPRSSKTTGCILTVDGGLREAFPR